MSAHTPGPWAADVTGNSGGGLTVLCAMGRVVGWTSEMPRARPPVSVEEARANGALMAAAPDLLLACELVLASMTVEMEHALGEGGHELISAAVLRARGETP